MCSSVRCLERRPQTSLPRGVQRGPQWADSSVTPSPLGPTAPRPWCPSWSSRVAWPAASSGAVPPCVGPGAEGPTGKGHALTIPGAHLPCQAWGPPQPAHRITLRPPPLAFLFLAHGRSACQGASRPRPGVRPRLTAGCSGPSLPPSHLCSLQRGLLTTSSEWRGAAGAPGVTGHGCAGHRGPPGARGRAAWSRQGGGV